MGETLEKHANHGFTQFELSKNVLHNLKHFNLTPTGKLVLLYLSSCYNPNKADMFPKQKTIACKMGISERSVVRAIQELFKAGLIIIECKYTNRYKFTSKIVAECPENLSNHKGQNDILKRDNLSPHDKEQIKRKNKPTDDDFLIRYAEQRGVKNKVAYINAIKRNGGASEIVRDLKQAETNRKAMELSAQNTIKEYELSKQLADAPTENFKALKAKLIEMCK